jgi:VID27 N-terminal region
VIYQATPETSTNSFATQPRLRECHIPLSLSVLAPHLLSSKLFPDRVVVYQCMWERKYHRSHEEATEADLEQFNFAYRFLSSTQLNTTQPQFPSPPLTATDIHPSPPRLPLLLSQSVPWKREEMSRLPNRQAPKLPRPSSAPPLVRRPKLSPVYRHSFTSSMPPRACSCFRMPMSLPLSLKPAPGNVSPRFPKSDPPRLAPSDVRPEGLDFSTDGSRDEPCIQLCSQSQSQQS